MSAPRLDEAFLRERVWPRFSRAMSRPGIYLANHSLGRPPDRMADDVRVALDAWYREMGDAWDAWLAARERFRELTARLVGAPSPDCIVPKTSAGQGLRAVLNSFPGMPRVLATDEEFDSLDFILRVYRQQGRIRLKASSFDAFRLEPCDLVVLSTVAFRTGKVFQQLESILAEARRAKALVLLDVYHHAGVLPLDLAALDVDFAVGGSYKYLRGGPGACWLYVHPRHHARVTLDTGWFAKKDVFGYRRPDPPEFAAGGDAWLESTPPVLAPVQALAGLEITLELGVERLREHGLAQKKRLASLLAERGIKAQGADEQHGAFLTLVRGDAAQLAARLGDAGIKVDARGDYLRLCPDILTPEEELGRAAAALEEALRPAISRRGA
ncbi:MAG: aminotransferase class V-fold PLP-dependent enzyme [Betaproteobacteria bacterium]|nr:aminotransferase class V-fold PLP-dependent enzyme [Betaproteobacteria bacterium]